MIIKIQELNDRLEKDYSNLLEESRDSMFNHSLKFRKLLKLFIPKLKDHYL